MPEPLTAQYLGQHLRTRHRLAPRVPPVARRLPTPLASRREELGEHPCVGYSLAPRVPPAGQAVPRISSIMRRGAGSTSGHSLPPGPAHDC